MNYYLRIEYADGTMKIVGPRASKFNIVALADGYRSMPEVKNVEVFNAERIEDIV